MYIRKQYLQFLDEIRAQGSINMFQAGPYLQEEFKLSKQEAKIVLEHWMTQFRKRYRVKE